jgi:hypothetical protein
MMCEKVRENIPLYHTGDLREREMAQVRDHITECAICRQEVEEYESITHNLSSLREGKVPDGIWEDMWSGIREEIWGQRRARLVRPSFIPQALSYAASIVIGLGVGFFGYLGLGFEPPGLEQRPQVQGTEARDVELPDLPASGAVTKAVEGQDRGHQYRLPRDFGLRGGLRYNLSSGVSYPRSFPYQEFGVSYSGLSEALRAHLDIQSGGVLITEVQKGSPADRWGIKKYDILLKVNKDKITIYTFYALISPHIKGRRRGATPLTLTIVRTGERLKLKITSKSRLNSIPRRKSYPDSKIRRRYLGR